MELPSFGKQLFLGDFRLDLIHPQPKLDPEQIEKGERFLTELREVLASEADPLEIEREAKIPDNVLDALKRIGALGMKVPPEYGGLGLSQVYYSKALALAGNWHSSICTLLSAHQSIGVAEPLRMLGGGAAAEVAAAGGQGSRQRVPADRGRRRLRSGAHGLDRDVTLDDDITATPVEGGYRVNGRKLWATNGTIARHRRCDGEGAQDRRSPRRD